MMIKIVVLFHFPGKRVNDLLWVIKLDHNFEKLFSAVCSIHGIVPSVDRKPAVSLLFLFFTLTCLACLFGYMTES